jgi:hypothetical protein
MDLALHYNRGNGRAFPFYRGGAACVSTFQPTRLIGKMPLLTGVGPVLLLGNVVHAPLLGRRHLRQFS